jgi:uncharacterized protein
VMKLRNVLIGAVVLVFLAFWAISGKYLDLLWFKTMGPTTVFWVTLITGPLAKLIVGLVIFIFFLISFLIALKAFDRIQIADSFWPNISKKVILIPGLAISAVLAIILASGFSIDWTVIQQYLNRVTVGTVDPIFHQDLGFYLFQFPFYQQLNTLLQVTTFLGLIGTALMYLMAKAYWRQGRSWELWLPAKIHLTIITIMFLLVKIWGYQLGKYGLMLQESAWMTGINYTAEHAKITALKILIWIVMAVILLLVAGLFRKGSHLLMGSLIFWLAASFILWALYPGAIQSFVVTPNEYELESPYINNHIIMTRQAFKLDQIKLKSYTPRDSKTTLSTDNPSLADLRLWDYKPLIPSYNQLQAIRPYYLFNDIDIDRYPSATGQRQVMIGPRELNTDKLSDQAKTWINLHLTYTHGYGIAANQVSEFSSQGQPEFIARDLPPKADPDFPALKVDQPAIYFGELTSPYIIVNSRTPEFDYPQADRNISTTYQGTKGIVLNSPLIKYLMALRFQEMNFLLSSQLTPESSVLMYRDISTRIQKLAPFLTYDPDPYLVVSGGKLFWIVDAYTTSSNYPYSRYHQSDLYYFNYIRNSVKVVVDAFTGEVNFYIVDQKDPIIQVWQNIFPHLFKPLAGLAPDLVKHFRYPEFLLKVQRDMLCQYHMTNPKTFYQKEDYWEVPTHNQDEPFDPNYVTLKLPEEKKTEFVMMQPFSPKGKQNLISWLIARCDQPNYGEMVLYSLPRDQNIYGPAQIDSRINQDQMISQLFTLWNQQQSRVIWGNLLIIPLEDSILYVKPLFIEAERGQQAELKKVILVYQNQVLLGDSVAEAISRISFNPPAAGTNPAPTTTKEAKNLSAQRDKEAILKRLEAISKELQDISEKLRKQ